MTMAGFMLVNVALWLSSSNNKLIFGSGTELVVQPSEYNHSDQPCAPTNYSKLLN